MAAVGYSGIRFKPEKTDVYFNKVKVVKNGIMNNKDKEATEEMKKKELKIIVDLHAGKASVKAHLRPDRDYIKINAEYRTKHWGASLLHALLHYNAVKNRQDVVAVREYSSSVSANRTEQLNNGYYWPIAISETDNHNVYVLQYLLSCRANIFVRPVFYFMGSAASIFLTCR
jgi:hypothetical protein